MADKLQVGDVFKAKSLEFATYRHDNGKADRTRLEVGGEKRVTFVWTEHGKDGWRRHRNDVVDLDATDPTRADAEFVVIATEMSGGGTGHGRYDTYPDGWGVTAKRLHSDGSYDENGETVFFRQSGCFTNMLEDAVKVRDMKLQMV